MRCCFSHGCRRVHHGTDADRRRRSAPSGVPYGQVEETSGEQDPLVSPALVLTMQHFALDNGFAHSREHEYHGEPIRHAGAGESSGRKQ